MFANATVLLEKVLRQYIYINAETAKNPLENEWEDGNHFST